MMIGPPLRVVEAPANRNRFVALLAPLGISVEALRELVNAELRRRFRLSS